MKKALILHGLNGHDQENWFPWLKQQLEDIGYQVWCPNLPGADHPDSQRINAFILGNQAFEIDQHTILIGHSSGAVAILGLLQALPGQTQVRACYLVGSFKNDLGMPEVRGLFSAPFDFAKIRTRSRLWYFLHSDNDPYCPLEHAEYLHREIGGDLIVLKGQKHFSVGTMGERYTQFPYLYHLIAEDTMTAQEVWHIYSDMENQGVKLWLDGGWAVDALIEKQTRPHGDLDIVIEKKDVSVMVEYLMNHGYWEIARSDTSSHNFMYGNEQAQLVDFHVIELDANGNGVMGPIENGAVYPAAALRGSGVIDGHQVRCISAEWSLKFHTGYPPREKDRLDVAALRGKFGKKVA